MQPKNAIFQVFQVDAVCSSGNNFPKYGISGFVFSCFKFFRLTFLNTVSFMSDFTVLAKTSNMTAGIPMNKTSASVKLEVQSPNIKIPTIIKPGFFVQLTPRPRRKNKAVMWFSKSTLTQIVLFWLKIARCCGRN